MEFKLNKIDVEIRQRVKDTTKSGVVHRKDDSITVNKDRDPKDNSKSYEEFKGKLMKYKKNHKIIVGAYRNNQYEIEVFKEVLAKEQKAMGNFIDTKK